MFLCRVYKLFWPPPCRTRSRQTIFLFCFITHTNTYKHTIFVAFCFISLFRFFTFCHYCCCCFIFCCTFCFYHFTNPVFLSSVSYLLFFLLFSWLLWRGPWENFDRDWKSLIVLLLPYIVSVFMIFLYFVCYYRACLFIQFIHSFVEMQHAAL